jgi:hypothetical protein
MGNTPLFPTLSHNKSAKVILSESFRSLAVVVFLQIGFFKRNGTFLGVKFYKWDRYYWGRGSLHLDPRAFKQVIWVINSFPAMGLYISPPRPQASVFVA